MDQQFFGKEFWMIYAALAAVFGLSILAFQTAFVLPLLVLILIGAVALTVHRLEFGLVLAFAELFANSHGHLLSAEVAVFPLSLRISVFLGVMGGWVVRCLLRRSRLAWRDPRLTPYLLLVVAVLLGFAVGFANNSKADAFADGNAYMYIAYILPILSVAWDDRSRRLLLETLAAGAAWVTSMTVGLLYIFTHFPLWVLGPTYTFIRDTRTGELTRMDPTQLGGDAPDPTEATGFFFRIFLQAQISIIFLTFLLWPGLWTRGMSKRAWTVILAALSLGMMAILVSLSRSFWVGMIAGGATYLALTLWIVRPKIWPFITRVFAHVVTVPTALVLLVLVILFPFPYRTGSTEGLASLFSSRATNGGEVAISSRWNLLDPLMEEIKSSPVLGSGFGETVTFKTDDPRARAISPDGTWTTYALEWGWLELWLKMGVLGPIAFAWLFVSTVVGLWPMLKSDRAWLGIGFISSLVMLYATHMFSPYLNHPLGLGMLLVMVPFLQTKTPRTVEVSVKDQVLTPAAQPSVASFTSE